MRFSSGEHDGTQQQRNARLSRQRLHGVALLAGVVSIRRMTENQGSGAVLSGETYVLRVFFRVSEASGQKAYVES
jgi:hypothetical protein